MKAHTSLLARGTRKGLAAFSAIAALATSGFAGAAASAGSYSLLYVFPTDENGTNPAGANPNASLLRDARGALYGTAIAGGLGDTTIAEGGLVGAGVVFRLAPPGPGEKAWTQTVLYAFGSTKGDGINPFGSLVADASGAVYGTTFAGGAANLGTAFKLTPPKAGQSKWTEAILYSFRGGKDGASPYANLIFDSSGALYGTTSAGGAGGHGTVFKLSPSVHPGATWNETLLYSFRGGESDGANPLCGLVLGANGALYGTTTNGGAANAGTVFELSPPSAGRSVWTETVLYSFPGPESGANPIAGLTPGSGGALYGVTTQQGANGWGTVYELSPPGTGKPGWTFSVLHSFTGWLDGGYATGPLAPSANGALYGTTALGGNYDQGALFQLSPPVDGGAWVLMPILSFHGLNFANTNTGVAPGGGLTIGTDGTIYGATTFSAPASFPNQGGPGTVFELR